jgi:hypothetical protein
LIHCDLWTSPVLSISGYKYYLVILDDYSHFLWTFPLRLKSDTLPTLTQFFAWVSTQFRRSVCTLQCDNGREFDNHAARSFFLTHGVQLRLSCPYTSAQNGRAECMIRTTTNMICCLLFQASLPATYWAEALHTATHLLNRLPSKATSHPTPHFALHGTTPSYDHLRVFGCACYPNTSATTPHKLSPRSTRCLFLGYSPDHKGYRCLDLTSHRIIISRHLVFDEDVFPLAGSTSPTDLDSLLESDLVTPPPPPVPRLAPLPAPRAATTPPFALVSAPPAAPSSLPAPRTAPSTPSRLARLRRPCLRHAWPRRLLLRHARPRRPQLASPTLRSSTTVATTPLPRRLLTWTCRHARPASPTPLSSITAASRPCLLPLMSRQSAPSHLCTTRSPSTATPGMFTRW